MSTQKTTTDTNSYNSQSMNAYNGMQSGISSSINDYMNAPSKMVPLWQQQANSQIALSGQRNNSNLMQNATTNGYGNGSMPAFMQSQLAANGRSMAGQQSNAFLNSTFQGLQTQEFGTQAAENYHPLQTGSTQVQQTSGTGTWLPQVLSAGMNLGMGFLNGGQGSAGAGGSGAAPDFSSQWLTPSTNGSGNFNSVMSNWGGPSMPSFGGG